MLLLKKARMKWENKLNDNIGFPDVENSFRFIKATSKCVYDTSTIWSTTHCGYKLITV